MDTLKDKFLTIKDHYSFTYNDGLALYDFTLQSINDAIAEFSVKTLELGIAEFITTVQRFDVEQDDWGMVGTISVDLESASNTDAVIEHCRHIWGVPEFDRL